MNNKLLTDTLFYDFGGSYADADSKFPLFNSTPKKTAAGTPYLTTPGVALVGRTVFNPNSVAGFLEGFDEELGFEDYLDDEPVEGDGAGLAKFAGQLCYMSFGEKRTKNADADKYHEHIRQSRHGSVIEHPSYNFLVWGIDRSVTHEAVRHRVGIAFSQVSQRYVDGKVLRFVERVEYQGDDELHQMFTDRIDRQAKDYSELAGILMDRQQKGDLALSGDKKTELRKKVNQCARSLLANETEAPLLWTGNARAWRHVLEMRAAGPADLAIRAFAVRAYLCLNKVDPHLFSDYSVIKFDDGTFGVTTDHRKV
jgi:thymidylate synthase (FAD)